MTGGGSGAPTGSDRADVPLTTAPGARAPAPVATQGPGPDRTPAFGPHGHDELHAVLRGVHGLLLDMDGVVVLKGAPIPGAPVAIRTLHDRGIPFRFLTNTSLSSRATLAARLTAAGIPIEAEAIASALSASAELTRRRWPRGPLYVLGAPDALTEFAGQRVLSDAEAGGPEATAAAVIVGDAGPDFTYPRLNAAFRLVLRGARLVAMHRNRWWLTPDGITLDSGAFVRGLEFAAGRRALVVGKPSSAFFEAALSSLGVPREATLVVGDDLAADIGGASRAGLRSAFVLSGKHTLADLAGAVRRPGGVSPDAVAPSLVEIVAALD